MCSTPRVASTRLEARNMHSLHHAACQVLVANTPDDKTARAHDLARLWRENALSWDRPEDKSAENEAPTHPGRPDAPELVSPRDMGRRRLGSQKGRCALLHAIAHIEFNAINLAADMVARYAQDLRIADEVRAEFITDWVGVCDDEARHFTMINTRLIELESHYGAFPAHNGLWEAAISTMDDVAARLVVAPMVLEARGLDVTPNMIRNLEKVDDIRSANILKTIYEEEIGHVAAGARWFLHICERENRENAKYFKILLDKHFKGLLKPPFNEEAREKAGLPLSFYKP